MGDEWDVIVMGGGPAGSAAGIFLAQAGMRVVMVEAGRHPRHHIGESLLPGSIPILERLGVGRKELAARWQPKYGARFYDVEMDMLETFDFSSEGERLMGGEGAPAFQVWRADFDAMLYGKAREAGVEVMEGAKVVEVEGIDGDGGGGEEGCVKLADGRRVMGRFLVDATGRGAVMAGKLRQKEMLGELGRLAVYSYFRDLPGHDERDADFITMYIFEGGWVWLIPLRDGRTSVGVVLKREAIGANLSAAGQFAAAVERMPRLKRRLARATRTEDFRVEADYSYAVAKKYGAWGRSGYVLVGDAAGFLDPIFSSGVHLALSSAQMAAKGIVRKLRDGDDGGLEEYQAYMMQGFGVFKAFVERFYRRGLVRNVFFAANKPETMRRAIVNILAGRVWDGENPVIRQICGKIENVK